MKNKFSSSILHDGHLYGFDEKTLTCIDVETGAVRWKTRGLGHGSLVYADERLYVLGDKGILVLVEATPDEYRETGRIQPFRAKAWTLPTVDSGRLFIRNENTVNFGLIDKKLTGYELIQDIALEWANAHGLTLLTAHACYTGFCEDCTKKRQKDAAHE